jgi:fructose-bisphosphate aldolase, class II
MPADIVRLARQAGLAIPAFNIPYLPMMKPVVQAIIDQDCLAMVMTARPEWIKFEGRSLEAVREEYDRWAPPGRIWLHLDHVPAIDEDNEVVDYPPIFARAIAAGYQSLMIDGSRLSLEDNIAATWRIAEMAHAAGIPVEAELGAVLGHEAGPLPPYEELFASGKGFTDVDEARRFAHESGCDWLSVAIGNIHGAISAATKDLKKVEARLNLERLEALHQAAGVPLVLHGGSGVKRENVLASFAHGIAKVNIATEIRQAYERTLKESGQVEAARQAVYERTTWVIRDYFGLEGSYSRLVGG